MPAGRPSSYDPAYCEEMVEYCRDGKSITGFAGKIGVSRDCLTKWGQQYPEFLLAIKAAKSAATYGVEIDAARQRKENGGSASVTIFQLKNFAPDDYRDTQVIDQTVKSDVSGTLSIAHLNPVDAMEAYANAIRKSRE